MYNDSKIILRDEEDIYSLSHKFWEYFAETYGFDMAIQIRKFKSLEMTLPENVKIKEREWVSFERESSFHYNIYDDDLHDLPLHQRLANEQAFMDEI